MPCDHTDPPVIMEKAEQWLRQRGISESEWNGMRLRHSENTPNAKGWKSVVIEIERRGDEWIVTDIDRRQETLPDGVRSSILDFLPVVENRGSKT